MVPPAVPSSPSSQYTQQFLSSVLSQRGPEALPYSEDLKWLIRQHLLALVEAYPSLQPKTGIFTHNDGRTVFLLQADGTVPMLFQGVTYNIPVVIWLMESYPRHPPLVFVNPTRDMIIKRPHPFVNPSGIVAIPYLQNWIYPSSNLVELARNLGHYFSRDPPLFSQRRPNPNPSPTPNPSPSTSAGFPNSASIGSHPPSIRPAMPPPRAFPQSPYGTGSGGSERVMDDPSEVYKRNAINKLVENLHSDILVLRKAREADMDGMFNAQSALKQRELQLSNGLKEMQDEKEGLEQQLQMVLMNSDLLDGWLKENEAKVKNLETTDVGVDEEVFEPCDALSKQMLECTASDLAIEDVVYSLDKAVQEGAIPFDQYLRAVRLLSREQFFHRATASKVRAAQMQAQVANMASKASQYSL